MKSKSISELINKKKEQLYQKKSTNSRSSQRRCSVRKGALRNFGKFTGKHLCQSLFFNKVAGLRSATLLKKRLWHRCFPVNFPKFLRRTFLQNTSGRLLLSINSYSCFSRRQIYLISLSILVLNFLFDMIFVILS